MSRGGLRPCCGAGGVPHRGQPASMRNFRPSGEVLPAGPALRSTVRWALRAAWRCADAAPPRPALCSCGGAGAKWQIWAPGHETKALNT